MHSPYFKPCRNRWLIGSGPYRPQQGHSSWAHWPRGSYRGGGGGSDQEQLLANSENTGKNSGHLKNGSEKYLDREISELVFQGDPLELASNFRFPKIQNSKKKKYFGGGEENHAHHSKRGKNFGENHLLVRSRGQSKAREFSRKQTNCPFQLHKRDWYGNEKRKRNRI